MSPRERVLRCLEFNRPDRVPRDLWWLPIAELEHGKRAFSAFRRRWPADIVDVDVPNKALMGLRKGDPYLAGEYQDEWGCVFKNIQAGVIGQVKTPRLGDWSKLDRLRVPVEALSLDVEQINQFCTNTDKFVLAGCCPRLFERMQFLRGSENLYLDIAEDVSGFRQLLKTLHEFYCQEMGAWAHTQVDALTIMDDWGSQRSLLISPRKWRMLFKPLYAEYVQIAHGAGKKIFMHSDGHIFEIYEDLIEIGIDAINSQLFCMNIENIGQRFAGRITFWGEIDRQWVLPFGTATDARAAVKRVVDNLYRPEGGVIAQFEVGAAAKIKNAHAVFDAWHELTS